MPLRSHDAVSGRRQRTAVRVSGYSTGVPGFGTETVSGARQTASMFPSCRWQYRGLYGYIGSCE